MDRSLVFERTTKRQRSPSMKSNGAIQNVYHGVKFYPRINLRYSSLTVAHKSTLGSGLSRLNPSFWVEWAGICNHDADKPTGRMFLRFWYNTWFLTYLRKKNDPMKNIKFMIFFYSRWMLKNDQISWFSLISRASS